MRRLWLVGLAALALPASPAAAATYRVATTGNDAANGTSAPFRTLQRAAEVIQSGDTVVFEPGTYAAGAWIQGKTNVTLRGQGEVVFDAEGITRNDGIQLYEVRNLRIEGIGFRNARRYGIFCVLSQGVSIVGCDASYNGKTGILSGNSSDVLIENCTATFNRGEHGVYLSQSGDRLTVRNCKLLNNVAGGLQINALEEAPATNPDADSRSTDCLIEGNTITGNGSIGGAGINLISVSDSVVVNNLIANNLAGGVAMWDGETGGAYGCKNNRVFHNTIVFAPGTGRYGVQFLGGATGNQVVGNLISCGLGPCLVTSDPIQSDHNSFKGPDLINGGSLRSWQQATGNDLNSSEGVFVDDQFRPLAGSAAVDGATQVWDTDKDGKPRPSGANPDQGCFELQTADEPETPAPTGEIFGDALASGWSAGAKGATYFLGVADPVGKGIRAMSLKVQSRDGSVQLSGTGIAIAGRRTLKLLVHGGTTGNQQLRVRATVDGRLQPSLNLRNYGGLPKRGQWTEIVVPISSLVRDGSKLTGLTFSSGKSSPVVYLDSIRVE